MELNLHIDVNSPGVLDALGDMLVKLSTLQGIGFTDLSTPPAAISAAENDSVVILPRNPTASDQAPMTQAIQPEPEPKAPVQDKPAYTKEQLAHAAQPLMDAGRMDEISAMMREKFGVDALHQLPEEQYGLLATALREMGAKL